MSEERALKVIAHIKTDFPTKFGIPRQSGIVNELVGKIVFEKEYRNEDAIRGLEGYSHLWLLWEFSESVRDSWSPTVRPPRLGGNERVGVFATRSPFRPNPIGLSSVKICEIRHGTPDGTVIFVFGADLLDGTPIYDIKPYISYTDSHPDAVCGFATDVFGYSLNVEIPKEFEDIIPSDILSQLKGILSNDPRPAYQNDKDRIYSFEFAGFNVKFVVCDDTLRVIDAKNIIN